MFSLLRALGSFDISSYFVAFLTLSTYYVNGSGGSGEICKRFYRLFSSSDAATFGAESAVVADFADLADFGEFIGATFE